MTDKFNIRVADWKNATDRNSLKNIRTLVFIKEQKVPPALEWDGEDETALHLIAYVNDVKPIACTRLIISSKSNENAIGHIGRMAVLNEWRKIGVGMALLQEALKRLQQQKIHIIKLSAQIHAVAFYQMVGFKVCSELYWDAGIQHVDMELVNQEI